MCHTHRNRTRRNIAEIVNTCIKKSKYKETSTIVLYILISLQIARLRVNQHYPKIASTMDIFLYNQEGIHCDILHVAH